MPAKMQNFHLEQISRLFEQNSRPERGIKTYKNIGWQGRRAPVNAGPLSAQIKPASIPQMTKADRL